MNARRGFTLIELMVVLALLAVTAVAAIPAFVGPNARGPERALADSVAALLVQARDVSRQSGRAATLVISPADGRWWLSTHDSSSTGIVPLGASHLVATARDRITCRFAPQGPASPCAVTVHGAKDVSVRVSAWSGEVSVE